MSAVFREDPYGANSFLVVVDGVSDDPAGARGSFAEVSGLEVTKWLKEDDQLRDIPVVAVTAFAMKGDEERIREGGCEAYISKPISVMMFLDTVKQFIGEAR